MLEHLPLVKAPDAIWTRIEAELDRPAVLWPRWAIAAAVVLAVAASYWMTRPTWIEAGTSARTLQIAAIGSVELRPNTKVRVVASKASEQRLMLAHGEIHATINAPPRLFFVDTAAGTAVDLGCEYTLNSDDRGTGLLRVTRGWVAFQSNGLESLVPAGASCRTHTARGPGTPLFDDAPSELKRGVDAFDDGRAQSLGPVLSTARVRDTLTLWHLISRVPMAERGEVFDRIASLTPVPAISRAQALHLDPQTLTDWKDELAWTW